MEDPPDPEPDGTAQQWAFYSLWPRIVDVRALTAEEPPARQAEPDLVLA
jgi:hypothetical protein